MACPPSHDAAEARLGVDLAAARKIGNLLHDVAGQVPGFVPLREPTEALALVPWIQAAVENPGVTYFARAVQRDRAAIHPDVRTENGGMRESLGASRGPIPANPRFVLLSSYPDMNWHPVEIHQVIDDHAARVQPLAETRVLDLPRGANAEAPLFLCVARTMLYPAPFAADVLYISMR